MALEHLSLSLEIEPKSSHIRVTGEAIFGGVEDKLAFLLNPCLDITNAEIVTEGVRKSLELQEVRPPEDLFLPAAQYEVTIPEESRNDEELRVHFEYEGKIYRYSFDTSRIRSDFVELALYALWYPIMDFDNHPTFEVKLNSPEDWMWIMNAQEIGKDPHTWRRDTPATDLTLHGRPVSNAIKPEDSSLFWGEPRYLKKLRTLEDDFSKLREILVDWLGEPETTDLRIVLVPRNFGGAYARTGLIVIQDDIADVVPEKASAIIQYWNHEFAHSWFKKTKVNSYHNWVDEAFATYASFLAIEEIYGREEFDAFIEKYRRTIAEEKDLPSINTIERRHEKAHVVYYVYGTLILHEIREKSGIADFMVFMRRFAQRCVEQDVITTDDLTDVLNEVTGEDWSGFINDRISMTPSTLQ